MIQELPKVTSRPLFMWVTVPNQEFLIIIKLDVPQPILQSYLATIQLVLCKIGPKGSHKAREKL